MVHGLLRLQQMYRFLHRWTGRPPAVLKLYFLAVLCLIGTIVFSVSQVISVHSTTAPVSLHHWSIHFLSDSKLQFGNNTNNTDSNLTRLVWTHPELDILRKPPYHFLDAYKNPCWYEPLYATNVYETNKYGLLSPHVRGMAIKLMTEWNQRLARDNQPKRLRCLPYFFIIGMPKCGSTDLFRRILKHPDVVSPPIKELHWWSRNRMGKRLNYTDIIPLSHYIDMFDEAALRIEKRGHETKNQIITGEASVSVMWENDDWYHFPENLGYEEPVYTTGDYMKHLIPDLKIIVILRNPADRLFSDYLYFNPTANKSLEDFHSRVNFSVNLYERCFQNHSIRHCLYNNSVAMISQVRLRIGVYSVYLQDWLRAYDKNNILVLTLNEYSTKVVKTMRKVFDFLQLRNLSKEQLEMVKNLKRQNKRKYKDKRLGSMLNNTKLLLENFYRKFDEDLKEILSENFTWE